MIDQYNFYYFENHDIAWKNSNSYSLFHSIWSQLYKNYYKYLYKYLYNIIY